MVPQPLQTPGSVLGNAGGEPAPALAVRISSTALVHSPGGRGLRTSLMRKSPFGSSGTRLGWSHARSRWRVAAEQRCEHAGATLVPMLSPPPSSSPSPWPVSVRSPSRQRSSARSPRAARRAKHGARCCGQRRRRPLHWTRDSHRCRLRSAPGCRRPGLRRPTAAPRCERRTRGFSDLARMILFSSVGALETAANSELTGFPVSGEDHPMGGAEFEEKQWWQPCAGD